MNAHLNNAILTNSDFSFSKLSGACLIKTDARNANFFQADLFSSNFTGADLRGANLLEAHRIEDATFSEVLYDKKTMWPEGFTLENRGLIYI